MRLFGLICLALATLPQAALAHAPLTPDTPMGGAFFHAALTWDHAAMAALMGMWAAFIGRPSIWAMPIVAMAGLLIGGVLPMAGVILPGGDVAIPMASIIFGLCVLFAVQPPIGVTGAMVGVGGLYLGQLHLSGVAPMDWPLMGVIGFVAGTLTAMAVGTAAGALTYIGRGEFFVRLGGAGMTALGVSFLAGAMMS
jgi:urease accessory protein